MNIDLYSARLAERLAYIKANADYFQEKDVYENTAMLISCTALIFLRLDAVPTGRKVCSLL